MVYKICVFVHQNTVCFCKNLHVFPPPKTYIKCKTVKSGGYELTLMFLCKANLVCFRSVVPRTRSS
ncbi:hypothetical protein HanXRQr2_Chr16g0744561 [Helianthus annuus]|uniref:Uncharacterized protein n=1 Tax=Helianthus annuus TaxID=4232 RepID=A0A9K3DS60_HELAN|nr:hypothetical protein HanXRQr2_Chr16g0744561 [Helianthus annuus]KAJ0820925.1 hypothetical protein HanPSC8_Chr16g0713861 [Helianthus annuus]